MSSCAVSSETRICKNPTIVYEQQQPTSMERQGIAKWRVFIKEFVFISLNICFAVPK